MKLSKNKRQKLDMLDLCIKNFVCGKEDKFFIVATSVIGDLKFSNKEIDIISKEYTIYCQARYACLKRYLVALNDLCNTHRDFSINTLSMFLRLYINKCYVNPSYGFNSNSCFKNISAILCLIRDKDAFIILKQDIEEYIHELNLTKKYRKEALEYKLGERF